MWKKLQGQLVEDWREAYKWLSVWVAIALAILAEAEQHLPIVRDYLPESWVKWAALAVLAARLIKQGKEKSEASDDTTN